MSAPAFATRNEAVADVVAAIESTGEVRDAWSEYDVAAICDEVIGDYKSGYAPRVTVREFWACVARHALPAADPGRKTLEEMISHAWDLAERAQNAGTPQPVLDLLLDALWALEDHLDHSPGAGDRAACVIALAQAAVVVGRCIA
ncbi:hypothetical protein ABLE94_02665 [Gordonia sp. VNK1]|uniref:hypothetical protein n=1 Tax=Gordonia oleivorans TaxID=3156618 RepID=UPI0032B5F370